MAQVPSGGVHMAPPRPCRLSPRTFRVPHGLAIYHLSQIDMFRTRFGVLAQDVQPSTEAGPRVPERVSALSACTRSGDRGSGQRMARSCAHRDQTRQGSNHFVDQIKCKSCGELLYKYTFAKVNDEMLLRCVRSKEYFDRLETTGSAQPRLAHPTGPSSSTQAPPPPCAASTEAPPPPLPASLSAEVIRKLTDAEVQQVIENERMKIRAEERSRLAKEIGQKGLIDMPTSSAGKQEQNTRISLVVDHRPQYHSDQQPPPEPDGGFELA